MKRQATFRRDRRGRHTKRKRFTTPQRGVTNRAILKSTGYVDRAVSNYTFDTTGSLSLIPTIAQGTSKITRVGQKVKLDSVQIRGIASSNSATILATGAMMIVHDRRPKGALPLVTAILTSVSPAAHLNDDNSHRFQIVRRWDYEFIGNNTADGSGKNYYTVNHFIPMNIPVRYNGTGTTGLISTIDEGALYLLQVGNQVTGTTAAATALSFRTRFTDVLG